MWPIKTILFTLLFSTLCAASLFNPAFGVMNYVLIYQVDPQSAWWGVPLRDLGLRFSLYAAIFTLAGYLLSQRPRQAGPARGQYWELGLLALVVIAYTSILTGVGYNAEMAARLDKFWKMMLFVFVMGRLISTRRELTLLLWTFVIGTLYLGREAFIAPPSRFHLGRLNDIGGPDFQFSSGFAVHLAAVLPLVGAAFLVSKRWYLKLTAMVTGAFGFNAMVLCRTRSAFVGLAAGAAVAALMAPKPRRFQILLTLGVCAAGAFTLTDPGFWDRMLTITDPQTRETDTAIVTRLDVWQVGLRMVADHPLGVGAGNFERMTRAYYHERRAAHNTFLNCVAELGIPAGVIFLAMLASSFERLRRTMKRARAAPHAPELLYIGYGLFVSLVTYVVAGFFTERFYTESFWWVLTLPLCLQKAVDAEYAAVIDLAHVGRGTRLEPILEHGGQRRGGRGHGRPSRVYA